MPRKLKTYTVIRVVKEEFEVTGYTKDEGKRKAINPVKVTVLRETIRNKHRNLKPLIN